MKRTRKWAFVAQEAQRLTGLGLTAAAIAKRLVVNRSTVTRWMRAGKLQRRDSAWQADPVTVRQTPAEWAAAVRGGYSLDATDDQLVTIGESALTLALNLMESAPTRMAAAGRFQAVVKQLALVTKLADSQVPAPKPAPERVIIRRSGVDPRNVLRAV